MGPQEPPFVPEQPIAIVNGDLIDATGTPPKLGYTVIIEGERITTVGSHDEVKIPDGALVIDAEGMTIMPGIINSNQHVQLHPLLKGSAADLPLDVLIARWDENFSRMPGKSYHYLMQGITSMRQTSGPSSKLLPLKQKIDSGEFLVRDGSARSARHLYQEFPATGHMQEISHKIIHLRHVALGTGTVGQMAALAVQDVVLPRKNFIGAGGCADAQQDQEQETGE